MPCLHLSWRRTAVYLYSAVKLMPHPDPTTLERFKTDRVLAHQVLFKHRHPDITPKFHPTIINHWHDRFVPLLNLMGFRESAKSTIGEEAIVLMACFKSFRNAIIVGENEARAADRLTAIKYELLNNDHIQTLFGDQMGEVWGYAKIILRNGVVIQALGRRQEVRGMKHLDVRPDLLFGDDLESLEHVKDEHARQETLSWLFAEVIPAMDKNFRARIHATPLDRESLPMTLQKMENWKTLKFPIKYRDKKTSEWRPTWPARYPLSWVDAKEKEMYRLGLHHDFMREYMCEAEDPAKKIFTVGMFNVVPRVHVWQPTFAMYDPARTATVTSSSTGWAVWSWIANRLIVWDGGGGVWKPDEIIDHIFKMNAQYSPVMIGVERDGLEEFLLQPLRHEMVKRGVILPIVPMKAPKGKGDFIESLQPIFNAGEIEFAKELDDLKAQFLSYPTGRIDGPNALAYAPILRPGLPIYENFATYHVVEQVLIWEKVPLWLCLNATQSLLTGVLVQVCDGALHVLADWVMEGDPGAALARAVTNAKLEGGREPRLVAGVHHFGDHDIVGLRGAVASLPAELRRASDPVMGRSAIRKLLEKQVRGLPSVQIAHAARWTLNAFSAGYAREIKSDGTMKQEARDGIYRVLMEGLEAFAGLLEVGMLEESQPVNWATTDKGVRYKTTLPGRAENAETKSKWIGTHSGNDRINDLRRFRS